MPIPTRTTPPITLQHVGWRWYQPDTGRFTQRDPIGIRGGLNVYEYCGGNPVAEGDPEGLVPPGGGCPYCGKMYCHCCHRPRPKAEPKPPRPKQPSRPFQPFAPNPKWRPHPLRAHYGYGPRPEPWPKNVVRPIMDDYVPFIGWPINAAANWVRLYRIWMPYEEGVIACFAAGTQVHTTDGSMSIDDLRPGMTLPWRNVASESGTAGAMVTAVVRSRAMDVIRVGLRDETITCTEHHPFWVHERGWVEAGDLTPDDCLVDRRGQAVPVVGVERVRLSEPVQIFDLTVSCTHTYYVGRTGVLVHNKPR